MLEYVVPFGLKKDVKSIVFSILTKEYPLKTIELTNYIRRRYGKDVTFQAVRKAAMALLAEGILLREDNGYRISPAWVKSARQTIDGLHAEICLNQKTKKSVESIRGEVSVFSFGSLNDMMQFWQDIIDDWANDFKPGDFNLNCYQAAHAWEALLHLDREKEVMEKLQKKGIKSHIVSTGNTPLDRSIQRFYTQIGVTMHLHPSSSSFDRGYYFGTYGDIIVQTKYPAELVVGLDQFFKKNKTIEDLDLQALSKIVHQKTPIKLTVIRNLEMAKQLNRSLLKEKKK